MKRQEQQNRLTFDYYYQFLNESAYIEQELQSYGSILSKTSIALLLRQCNINTFTLKETKEIKQMTNTIMDKMTQRIQRECSALIGVTATIRKISAEMRQVIDIAKAEQEKTIRKLAQYQEQMKNNENEIEKCQFVVEEQRNRQIEQQWRKLHYVHAAKQDNPNQIGGETYLRLLKDIKEKLSYHMSTQRKEQQLFTQNIKGKVNDLKTKMLSAWHQLPHCSKDSSPISQLTPLNKIKESLSHLEREYIKKEKQIDGFRIEQLGHIKKKLKILQEADMTESREHQICLNDDNRNMVESEVVELVNS